MLEVWRSQHRLAPHPEGGFFREVFRAPLTLTRPDGQPRAASTHILFALGRGTFSALHRVSADEIWHCYAGGPVRLTMIHPSGEVEVREVGGADGPCAVVPAGSWQAAEASVTDVLCGCTVAPGFDFADFEMPPRSELLTLLPRHEALITRLTRSDT